jgi:flagellar hook-associated protein 2
MAGTVSMVGLSSDINWTNLISDTIDAQKAAVEGPLTDNKTKYQNKLTAWQTFNTKVSAITDFINSNKLDTSQGYGLYTSSLYSSDPSVIPSSVVSVSLGTVSGPGKYSVEVSTLAQAEKISSDLFTSNTTALGVSGDIVVNGKVVSLSGTDTLNDVAGRINNADAGVTATILTISSTQYKLLLESESTGATGMSLKNGSASTVLQSLNLHTSTTQLAHTSGLDALSDTYTSEKADLAHASGADALSDTYTDEISAIGTLLGLATSPAGTIRIEGSDNNSYSVSIDLSTDTLDSIVTKINTANGGGVIPGVTASVEQVTQNGTTSYQLKLTNVDADKLTDSNNILATLGVLTKSAVGSLFGLTSAASGTVQIKGADSNLYGVAINLATDTLTDIANKINTANSGGAIPGVVASVEESTDENDVKSYTLKLTNVDLTDLQDDQNILETLGIVKQPAKNSLRTGQDASFKIDGNTITSASNTVTSAIGGVTLNLLGANVGKPVELSINQADTQVLQRVSSLVDNLKSVLSYIKDQNTYSSASTAKPLMGDTNLTVVKTTISQSVFVNVAGNTTYTTASSIGINFQSDGSLSLNSTKLSSALAGNRAETLNVLKTFSDSLYDNLKVYIDPLTGTLTSVTTTIQERMNRIDKQIAELDARFERQRAAMEKKYNALEMLISQSNLTKNWLTQQVNFMTK